MNFLAKLLRGIAFVPAIVHGIEALFGGKSGTDKKQAALSFVGAALNLSEAVSNREIVAPGPGGAGAPRVFLEHRVQSGH